MPSFIHVNNVHNPIPSQQLKDLRLLKKQVHELFIFIIEQIGNETISLHEIQSRISNILVFLDNNRSAQLINSNESDINTRTTMLYLGIMHETKNMLIHLENYAKAYENFIHTLPK
jgi:hypothetical protein